MPDKTIEGQEPESPTGAVVEPGQEQKTETPAVDLTDSIVNAAKKAEEPAASGELEPDPNAEKGEKPAPYDQDPKWLAARADQRTLQEILTENGIDDVDGLKTMLKTGMTLQEIVGDRDAKQIIQDAEDAKTLKKYNEYWDKQKRIEEDENLDPDEKAEKYKKELDDYKSRQADKQADAEKVKAGKAAIENYNSRVENVIETQSLDGESAKIAKMFLGVDNPFNTVDIFDQKAVKVMATEGLETFTKFLAGVRQAAIDEYAAGKSKIVPITPTETPSQPSATKKKLPEDASVEQVFASAKDELFELLAGGTSP